MEAVEILGKRVTVRDAPNVRGRHVGDVMPYAVVDYVQVVPDSEYPDDPRYQWLELANGNFCNYVHPPAGARFDLTPQYGYILHDHEREGLSRPELNKAKKHGLPETCPLVAHNKKWTSLTFEIQWFMFWILKRCGPTLTDAEIKKYFSRYLHSSAMLTNHGNGSDWKAGRANYVNGVRVDAEPMRMQPMTSGGNWHRLIGKPIRRRGLNYNVMTIDPKWLIDQIRQIAEADDRRMSKDDKLIEAARVFAMTFNQDTNRPMFFAPTNSTQTVLGPGIRQVDPFPMRDVRLGRDYAPFMPFMCYGGLDQIPASRIKNMGSDPNPPNPFVPERDF